MLKQLLGLFSSDLGIDLGTANTLVYVKDRGIVLREPSIVALQKGTPKIVAIGDEAKRMLGRTPEDIEIVRPLREGRIADFGIAEVMLRHFITKVAQGQRVSGPLCVVAVPSGLTDVERRVVQEAARRAGVKDVFLVKEALAAALGVGLPVQEPFGNMIVDIGGGTTEVAILSLGGIVFTRSIRVAGDEMDQAIIRYVKRAYNLMIGERTAEEIKLKIGSAFPLDKELAMEIRGRDIVAGLPKMLTLTSQEVREALLEPLRSVLESIRLALERCPPELSGDLIERGIVLAGGGALLRGIDRLVASETGLPIHVAEDPLTAVVQGTGKVVEEFKAFSKLAHSDTPVPSAAPSPAARW